MDADAMVRRAHEQGVQLETYDPHQLVVDVQDLLRERGLRPYRPEGSGLTGMAVGASGMLLRALGILPAGDYRMIDRVNAPDPETR